MFNKILNDLFNGIVIDGVCEFFPSALLFAEALKFCLLNFDDWYTDH